MDAGHGFVLKSGTLHRFENAWAGMLKRDVQVGQDLALSHQGNNFVDMRIGIDIVQTHPDAELRQGRAQLGHTRFDGPTIPEAAAKLDVNPIGAGVLGNNE